MENDEIEAIKKEFGWDLGQSIAPHYERNKFFFEADAEKLIRFLEKEKALVIRLEARVKELVDALNKIEAKETCDFGHKEEINILEARAKELGEALMRLRIEGGV